MHSEFGVYSTESHSNRLLKKSSSKLHSSLLVEGTSFVWNWFQKVWRWNAFEKLYLHVNTTRFKSKRVKRILNISLAYQEHAFEEAWQWNAFETFYLRSSNTRFRKCKGEAHSKCFISVSRTSVSKSLKVKRIIYAKNRLRNQLKRTEAQMQP